MLGLLVLCLTVGLVDSINPATVAPGVYLATVRRARASLASYTLAVFAVNFLGGLLITLGPGELIRSIAPHPKHALKHVLELGAGVVAAAAAYAVWRSRERIQARIPRTRNAGPRAAFVLGASIVGLELPTAFPYFAVIAAILGATYDRFDQVVALVVFNLAFTSPLIAMLALRQYGGDRAAGWLERFGDWFQRNSAALLAGVLVCVSFGFIVTGAIGLAGGSGRRHHRHEHATESPRLVARRITGTPTSMQRTRR